MKLQNQKNRQDRQIDSSRLTEREVDRLAIGKPDRQEDSAAKWETDRQTDTWIDRQKNVKKKTATRETGKHQTDKTDK